MAEDEEPRQRVERVPGARRARLTRVKGTLGDADAEATLRDEDAPPSDDPLQREKPPHY